MVSLMMCICTCDGALVSLSDERCQGYAGSEEYSTQFEMPAPCEGNQIQGECIQAPVPEGSDFAGPQPPVCVKWPTAPRINADKAADATAEFCAALAEEGRVLGEEQGEGEPREYSHTVEDAAEDGARVTLRVAYNKHGCPVGGETNTFEFSGNEDACVEKFYGIPEMVCTMDETWGDYDPDYTFLGGTFVSDCGEFSIIGEEADS